MVSKLYIPHKKGSGFSASVSASVGASVRPYVPPSKCASVAPVFKSLGPEALRGEAPFMGAEAPSLGGEAPPRKRGHTVPPEFLVSTKK